MRSRLYTDGGRLQDIGALDDDERLTRLGRHLAALPLPPKVGKMLLFAIMFGVLDPLLTGGFSAEHVLPVAAYTDGTSPALLEMTPLTSLPGMSSTNVTPLL